MFKLLKISYQIIEAIIVLLLFFIAFAGRVEAFEPMQLTADKAYCTSLDFIKDVRNLRTFGGFSLINNTASRYATFRNTVLASQYETYYKKANDTQLLIEAAINRGTLISLGERWLLDRNREIKTNLDAAALIKAQYTSSFNSYTFCLKAVSAGIPERLATITGRVEPYDRWVSDTFNLPAIQTLIPANTVPSTVFVFDSVVNKNMIVPEHVTRIDPTGKSWFSAFPTAITDTLGTQFTHGSWMNYLAMITSNTTKVYNEVTSSNSLVDHASIFAAAVHSITLKKAQPVVNMSFASIGGPDEIVVRSAEMLYNNNTPVVKAIGNAIPGAPMQITGFSDVYNPKILTVGYTVGGDMLSRYGKSGPDLLVNLYGTMKMVNGQGSTSPINAAEIMSSGATALVSGIVATMREVCPSSTPGDVYKAIRSTATRYVGKNSEYVRYGYVNAVGAINALKASPSCVDLNALTWDFYHGVSGSTKFNTATIGVETGEQMARSCEYQGGALQPYTGYPTDPKTLVACVPQYTPPGTVYNLIGMQVCIASSGANTLVRACDSQKKLI